METVTLIVDDHEIRCSIRVCVEKRRCTLRIDVFIDDACEDLTWGEGGKCGELYILSIFVKGIYPIELLCKSSGDCAFNVHRLTRVRFWKECVFWFVEFGGDFHVFINGDAPLTHNAKYLIAAPTKCPCPSL